MKSAEFLQSKVALGLALGVGALGIAGCDYTSYRQSDGRPAVTLSRNKLVVNYPDDNGEIVISCDGANLKETNSQVNNDYSLNDPDCKDGVLSIQAPQPQPSH